MMHCPGYHDRRDRLVLTATDDRTDRLHMCGKHGQPFDILRGKVMPYLHGMLTWLEKQVAAATDVDTGDYIYKIADTLVHLERQNTLLRSMNLEQYLAINPSAIDEALTIVKLRLEGRSDLPNVGAIESVGDLAHPDALKAGKRPKPAKTKPTPKKRSTR